MKNSDSNTNYAKIDINRYNELLEKEKIASDRAKSVVVDVNSHTTIGHYPDYIERTIYNYSVVFFTESDLKERFQKLINSDMKSKNYINLLKEKNKKIEQDYLKIIDKKNHEIEQLKNSKKPWYKFW